jgi:hypothetical protein
LYVRTTLLELGGGELGTVEVAWVVLVGPVAAGAAARVVDVELPGGRGVVDRVVAVGPSHRRGLAAGGGDGGGGSGRRVGGQQLPRLVRRQRPGVRLRHVRADALHALPGEEDGHGGGGQPSEPVERDTTHDRILAPTTLAGCQENPNGR